MHQQQCATCNQPKPTETGGNLNQVELHKTGSGRSYLFDSSWRTFELQRGLKEGCSQRIRGHLFARDQKTLVSFLFSSLLFFSSPLLCSVLFCWEGESKEEKKLPSQRKSHRKLNSVVVLDEMDYLDQGNLSQLFEWALNRNSRLVLIGFFLFLSLCCNLEAYFPFHSHFFFLFSFFFFLPSSLLSLFFLSLFSSSHYPFHEGIANSLNLIQRVLPQTVPGICISLSFFSLLALFTFFFE